MSSLRWWEIVGWERSKPASMSQTHIASGLRRSRARIWRRGRGSASTWIRRRIGDPGELSRVYLRGGTVFVVLAMAGVAFLAAAWLPAALDRRPLSLPIVSLTCFLIGLMLAYMGGAQLQRIEPPYWTVASWVRPYAEGLAPLRESLRLAGEREAHLGRVRVDLAEVEGARAGTRRRQRADPRAHRAAGQRSARRGAALVVGARCALKHLVPAPLHLSQLPTP